MNVAIYGLGLIGGSLGRALLAKTDHVVYGADINPSAVIKAKLLGAITDELDEEKLSSCDLVVFAVNPRAEIKLLPLVCPLLKKGATVTDCSGNKRDVVRKMDEMRVCYPELGFISAHPMAGREFSGIEHSTVGLYERSFVILTPVHSGIADFEKVKELFVSAGASGVTLATAEEHDEMISYTSQLAHVMSSAYAQNPLSKKHAGFSAGSFRDLTRVARLNADMWTELFLDNADELTERITELISTLDLFRTAIENNDEKSLRSLLEKGTEMKLEAENAIRIKRKEDK